MEKLHIKISKRIYIDILFGLLLLCTFLRYGLEINIPTIILLCISLLIITLGNNSEILAMCLCCIPLHSSFDYLYVVLYACIVLLLKNYKKIKIDYMVVIVMTIFLWELLHSIDGVFLIKQLVGLMASYLLVLSLHFCRKIKIDYHYTTMMFVRFVTLIGMNLFFRTLKLYGNNFGYAIQQMERLGTLEDVTILGGQINPNSLGVLCVLAITMLLQSYLYIKKEKKAIVYILLLFTIGMLTLSKTYVVLLVISIFLFIAEQQKSKKGKPSTTILILLVLVLGGIIFVNLFPTVVETFIGRWNVQDLSSGRNDIMKASIEALRVNPKLFWFGIGLQNYAEEALKYVYFAPHNVIHEIIFAWGLPGIFLFISFILLLVMEAKKENKHLKIVNFIPLVIIAAKAVAGHWITSSYTMLTITLIYLSMLFDFSSTQEIVKK